MTNGKNLVKRNHLIKVGWEKLNKLTILSEMIVICPPNKLYLKIILLNIMYFNVIITVIMN